MEQHHQQPEQQNKPQNVKTHFDNSTGNCSFMSSKLCVLTIDDDAASSVADDMMQAAEEAAAAM